MAELEVCVESLSSAKTAIQAGVTRIEVCSNLSQGGLTPSCGLVVALCNYLAERDDGTTAAKTTRTPSLFLMIRSRAGSDFVYTEDDMRTMVADVEVFQSLRVQHPNTLGRFVKGVVFGALAKDGSRLDESALEKILLAASGSDSASPLEVTFHRAIDRLPSLEAMKAALSTIVAVNEKVVEESSAKAVGQVTTILTSGGQSSAGSATALVALNAMQHTCNGLNERKPMTIMAGGGVNSRNVESILATLHGASSHRVTSSASPLRVHCSAKQNITAGTPPEDMQIVVDAEVVAKMVLLTSTFAGSGGSGAKI